MKLKKSRNFKIIGFRDHKVLCFNGDFNMYYCMCAGGVVSFSTGQNKLAFAYKETNFKSNKQFMSSPDYIVSRGFIDTETLEYPMWGYGFDGVSSFGEPYIDRARVTVDDLSFYVDTAGKFWVEHTGGAMVKMEDLWSPEKVAEVKNKCHEIGAM